MIKNNTKPSVLPNEPELIRHSRKAKQFGVCTSTLDEWVRLGILSPPLVINGRKYHRPDTRPRTTAG